MSTAQLNLLGERWITRNKSMLLTSVFALLLVLVLLFIFYHWRAELKNGIKKAILLNQNKVQLSKQVRASTIRKSTNIELITNQLTKILAINNQSLAVVLKQLSLSSTDINLAGAAKNMLSLEKYQQLLMHLACKKIKLNEIQEKPSHLTFKLTCKT